MPPEGNELYSKDSIEESIAENAARKLSLCQELRKNNDGRVKQLIFCRKHWEYRIEDEERWCARRIGWWGIDFVALSVLCCSLFVMLLLSLHEMIYGRKWSKYSSSSFLQFLRVKCQCLASLSLDLYSFLSMKNHWFFRRPDWLGQIYLTVNKISRGSDHGS